MQIALYAPDTDMNALLPQPDLSFEPHAATTCRQQHTHPATPDNATRIRRWLEDFLQDGRDML